MNTRERYEEIFSIASYEADIQGNCSLFALFNRFQDIAGKNATSLQVGYDELQQMKLAWVLSRIKVQIHAMPRWEETVIFATWPKGIDRLFALRDFCLTNEKGETLAVATSAWLLIDIEKGRPRKIESLPVNLQFPSAPHAIQEPLDKIQLPENMLPIFEKPIWLSDIDMNCHVNNAQYAKWITDCFPQEQSLHRHISSVQINFLEETLLGDTITLLKTPKESLVREYFLSGVSRTKGTHVFQANVRWEE
jgi:medium-chain acyl-[acyl-carrier-protein] hydrolase